MKPLFHCKLGIYNIWTLQNDNFIFLSKIKTTPTIKMYGWSTTSKFFGKIIIMTVFLVHTNTRARVRFCMGKSNMKWCKWGVKNLHMMEINLFAAIHIQMRLAANELPTTKRLTHLYSQFTRVNTFVQSVYSCTHINVTITAVCMNHRASWSFAICRGSWGS